MSTINIIYNVIIKKPFKSQAVERDYIFKK